MCKAYTGVSVLASRIASDPHDLGTSYDYCKTCVKPFLNMEAVSTIYVSS